jgi:multidrug efflux pump subunit AcrB
MIRYFTSHPTAANLVMMAFVVIGLFAAPTLQRETFPRLESRRVQVQVIYPGARPEDVEEGVCQRIEDAIDSVSDVKEVKCEANENVARAVIEMVEGADLERFTSDVKTEVEAITDFPDQAEKPIISQLGRTDFVASVVVTGPESKTELKAYAENLKDVLLQAGGIPKVAIAGFSDRQFRIEIPDIALRQHGLSAADVARAIQRQNIDLPSGSLKTSQSDLLVRFADQRKSVNDIARLVIVSSSGGGQIMLGEIAKITDRFELDEEAIVFNGKKAAVLNITKTEKEDTLNVIERVREVLAAQRKLMPPGISLVVSNDLSSIVKDRLRLLITNGAQGLALVFLVLWLFFGFRYSFWVAAGLPVSFLGALAMMAMLGYSINMITMVALLIVIGLLMDDAIVIAENVASQRSSGKAPLEAAIAGTGQVLPSVFASFATTTCVFGSLAFLKGDIGQILKVIPAVMLLVLVVSLIEAFLILPNHLYHAIEKNKDNKPGRVQQLVNDGVNWFGEHVIRPTASWAVRWRYLTVGIAVGAMIITVSMIAGGVLKFSPFPDLDGDVIEARILLPQGTPLERTRKVVGQVRAAIERVNSQLTPKQPGKKPLVKNLTIKYNKNVDAHESGAHVATIVVDLLGSEVRSARVDDVIADWRRETGNLADVVAIRFTEPTTGPGGLAIDIRMQGRDLDVLKKAARELKHWLRQFNGVLNVLDDLRPGKREIRVHLKDGASSLGVDALLIADQLRSAFFGSTVGEIQRGADSFEIDVRLARGDRNSLGDLDYFTITTGQGKRVPLAVVADVEFGRGVSRINRINGLRTVTVQGDVDVRYANAGEILAKAKTEIFPQIIKRYPQISVGIEGSNNDAKKTQQSMIKGFAIGLIGVFLLLSFQFRSYVEPVVVMIIVPFAFIGAVWGHIALGLEFTMPSMMGFVALAGVVVNDSILLVNFIKHHHGTTNSVLEAAPLASQARFRAILLTSLTTVAGLTPMLFETSLQAQILIPLVTSLAFGLTSATVLVLFLVPAFYAIIDDMGFARLD